MKAKSVFFLTLAVIAPALWMRSIVSWRPQILPGIICEQGIHISRDGESLWAGDIGGDGQAFAIDTTPGSEPTFTLNASGLRFRLYKGMESFPCLVRRYDGTHFQMKAGGKQVIMPQTSDSAFSLSRQEIYTLWPKGNIVSIWDLATGHLKRQVRCVHTSPAAHNSFSPDGKWLLSVQTSGRTLGVEMVNRFFITSALEYPSRLRRYDVQSGKLLATPNVYFPGGGVGKLKFSVDGKYVLTSPGFRNDSIVVFDTSTWRQLWKAKDVLWADWLADGQVAITRAEGLEWRNARTGQITQTRFGSLRGTKFWTTSWDGNWIYTSDSKSVVRRWRAK